MSGKNHLKRTRQRAGLTLTELAERVGTTATQLSRLENGQRKLTPLWIERIAKALAVDPNKLTGEQEPGVLSKLIFEAHSLNKEGETGFDFGLLIMVTEIIQTLWEIKNLRNTISPRIVTWISISNHNTFYELYLKIGRTPELIEAIKQSVYYHLSTMISDGLDVASINRLLQGKISHKELDSRFDFWRDIIDVTKSDEELVREHGDKLDDVANDG